MLRQFSGYIWGMIVRPRTTLDELAQQTSIRPAVMLVIFVQLLAWLNWLIYFALTAALSPYFLPENSP